MLKKEALSGRLKYYDHVHFVSWQVLLGVLSSSVPEGSTDKCWQRWEKEAKAWREEYSNLKSELLINPHHGEDGDAHDATNDNPLSNSENSTWAQYFANSELRKDILRDVDRTYPEIDFFRDVQVQELLTMVLFIYAKQHPALVYKQGMHEILALPFLMVHRERVEKLSAEKYTVDLSEPNYSSLIQTLYDPAYIEHDLYRLFSRILEHLGPFYQQSRNVVPPSTPKPDVPTGGAEVPAESPSGSAVLRKCKLIQDVLLKKHDEQLSAHLNEIELEPQLYLLRWIRILFGREFHLEDTVTVWDSIFAYDDHFGFLDYMAVAMLIFIRGQLLSRDFSDCIKRLQKYPPVEDVTILIEHAIALTKPKPAGLVGPLPFPSSLPASTTPPVSAPQPSLVTVSSTSSKPATPAVVATAPKPQVASTPQKPIVYASPAYNSQAQVQKESSSKSSSIFGGALTGANAGKRNTSSASDAQILKATPLHTPPPASKTSVLSDIFSKSDANYVTVPRAEWEELNRKVADQNLKEAKFSDKLSSVIASLQGILTSSEELEPQQVTEVLVMTVAGLKKTRDVASGLLQDDDEEASPFAAFSAMAQQMKAKARQNAQNKNSTSSPTSAASAASTQTYTPTIQSTASIPTTTNSTAQLNGTMPQYQPAGPTTSTQPPTIDILGMIPPDDTGEWVFAPVAVTGKTAASIAATKATTAAPVSLELQASSDASKAAMSSIFD